MSTDPSTAHIAAGIPQYHSSLFWRIRFSVCDQVVLLEIPSAHGVESVLILRDIEMQRAKQTARVDRVACPADFTPDGGLSGDRETANAQAAAECLRRAGITRVIGDRSLPLIFADFIRRAGISVDCDPDRWVLARRKKSTEEIQHLRDAQAVTEEAVQLACNLIATSDAGRDGFLVHQGSVLTSEKVRAAVDHFLLDQGFSNPMAIIAAGPSGADCHHLGSGPIRTAEPVIVDIFPMNRRTRYHGDCTRTVVHGDVPDEIRRMHAAVLAAKSAAEKTVRAGVSGEDVHHATIQAIMDSGYAFGLPDETTLPSYCAMTHGTGHGIGLDVHEPPLLDIKGPTLIAGEALTIEPGLYRRDLGGVRVEDMVVVTDTGCENLNRLHDGLSWA